MARGDRLTQYDGCCDKYGSNIVGAVALGMPILFNALSLAVTDSLYIGTAIVTSVVTLYGANKGFSSACDEHFRVQKQESKKKSPLDVGNDAVQKAQRTTYFKKLAPVLLFNLAVAGPAIGHYEENFWDENRFDSSHMTFYRK